MAEAFQDGPVDSGPSCMYTKSVLYNEWHGGEAEEEISITALCKEPFFPFFIIFFIFFNISGVSKHPSIHPSTENIAGLEA